VKVFVFNRLKEDLEVLSKKILSERPDFVVGITGARDISHFKSWAINQFNEKKVLQNGEQHLDLHIPENPVFLVSSEADNTFSNYAAYKIANLIKENKLDTKMVFAHVKNKDMNEFLDYLAELE